MRPMSRCAPEAGQPVEADRLIEPFRRCCGRRPRRHARVNNFPPLEGRPPRPSHHWKVYDGLVLTRTSKVANCENTITTALSKLPV